MNKNDKQYNDTNRANMNELLKQYENYFFLFNFSVAICDFRFTDAINDCNS